MKGDFSLLRRWLEGGGNRTIELALGNQVQLVARVGGEPYTSGGGATLDEAISWLEVKLFPEVPEE